MTRGWAAARMLLVASTALACGPDSDSVVVVDVDAPPAVTGVVRLRATLSNAGSSDVKLFPVADGGAGPLAFPSAFSVTLARARSGAVDIALDGLGAGDAVVANGAGSVRLDPGNRVEVRITLAAGASLCGNGRVDPGEQCDDGDRVTSGTCDYRCQLIPGDAGTGDAGVDAGRGGAGGGGGRGDGGAGAGGAAVDAPVEVGSCAVSLIVNGNFDLGESGWSQSSTANRMLIYRDDDPNLAATGVTPDSPRYLAWLGDGVTNETAILSQQVSVPADALTLRAQGAILIQTMESDAGDFDLGYLELADASGATTPFHRWSNRDHNDNWATFDYTIDATALRGTTTTFQMRATTDDAVPTDFFFDTLSLTASSCAAGP
jgi:cysteine-rich repeat protein